MKFLELEVIQANAKVDQVSTKKLDDVISSQKTFSDKIGLGYTRESSSNVKVTKEVKFVKAHQKKLYLLLRKQMWKIRRIWLTNEY